MYPFSSPTHWLGSSLLHFHFSCSRSPISSYSQLRVLTLCFKYLSFLFLNDIYQAYLKFSSRGFQYVAFRGTCALQRSRYFSPTMCLALGISVDVMCTWGRGKGLGCEVGGGPGQTLADSAIRKQPLPVCFSPFLPIPHPHTPQGPAPSENLGNCSFPKTVPLCFGIGGCEEEIFRGWPASPCLLSPQRGSSSAPMSLITTSDKCWAGEVICHESVKRQ